MKLYRQREDGEEVVVTICTAGETFAEGAMFMGGRYPVSAETVSFARIIRVDGAALRRAIEQRPQLAFDMLAAASCQSARKTDPRSASKIDPFVAIAEASARGGAAGGVAAPPRVRDRFDGLCQARCLKRQLSFPVSTMSQ